jgi:hypothetical protein
MVTRIISLIALLGGFIVHTTTAVEKEMVCYHYKPFDSSWSLVATRMAEAILVVKIRNCIGSAKSDQIDWVAIISMEHQECCLIAILGIDLFLHLFLELVIRLDY